MIIDEDTFLDHIEHYGTKRHSGRYPWGSGGDPYQRYSGFLGTVNSLRKQGLTPVEIARMFSTEDNPVTTGDIRKMTSIANEYTKAEERARARRLADEGNSNVAIGKLMGLPEATVRERLKPAEEAKKLPIVNTADALRHNLEKNGGFLDIGRGTANHLGVSPEKLASAVALLREEDYTVGWYRMPTTGGRETTTMVLIPPGKSFKDVVADPSKIKSLAVYSEDGGRSFIDVKPPVSVDPKRVSVRYNEDGGGDKDGVIELRRGVPDLSLKDSRYAQVRIKVGDNHYLKGMAMYSDDIPDGVDMVFNTNKSNKGDKLKAMKEIKKDAQTGEEAELPFGSIVRQITYDDPKTGKSKQSPLNIVGSVKKDEDGNDISYSGEEGGWGKWSNTLSSQFTSKQSPELARRQLDEMHARKKADLDEILELNNPVIRKKLLDSYADGMDSAAVHMKAAGLPRTANHVILPINSLRDTEIYAPKYNNGETVALVRHPHAGPFEIPILTVNNRNREANRLIKDAKDAVGINSKVAGRLSGADFDGDTVLVIPQPKDPKLQVRSKPPLAGLVGFDPQRAHPPFDGMKTIDGGVWDAKIGKPVFPIDPKTGKPKSPNKQAKQLKMGDISNLITDMSLKGATNSELERAARHSMVVIDAEKHSLDYRTSAKVNNIAQLKEKYQGRSDAGAATLISRRKREVDVLKRRARPAAEGGNIDEKGIRRYVETGESYVNKKGETVMKTQKVRLMDITDDARTLVSKDGGTVMERVYADHVNRLKGLANQARLESQKTPSLVRNPSAAKAYAPEVASLASKLDLAQRNAPRERQAQLLAAELVKAKKESNPDLDKDGIKKIESAAIKEARDRLGSKKPMIRITDREWEAIQNGAVTNNLLKNVLDNADLDQVKQLATPRTGSQLAPAKIARAKAMLSRGYTQAEVANMLGVPASTLHDAINE